MIYDVIIIGAGPTGISIAVEAHKSNLSYLVIEKGMLVNSLYHFPVNMTFFSTSKNLEIADIPFISHSDKPTRKEALEYYRRIVESYQLDVNLYEAADHVNRDQRPYTVQTDKATYKTQNVIVTTGFYDRPRLLDIPGENLPKVKHYYDDAHPYVGQKVLVIGAANSACDVALETWQKGADVTMAIRESEIYKKVKYWIRPNIENRIKEGAIAAHFNTIVKEIKPHSVVLSNGKKEWEIENDFVLAMTGYQPDYQLLNHLGVPTDKGPNRLPLYDADTFETRTPHIYVAGVICAGMQTSKLFIENTRHHGKVIIDHILSKEN